MASSGCDAGDRWLVNELPTSWFGGDNVSSDMHRAVRARIASALKGLYYGGDAVNIKGFAADVVFSHLTLNMSEYKPRQKAAYADDRFWRALRAYADGFAKETYNRCSQICVANQSAASIADHGVNNYSYHQRFLALAAPNTDAYGDVKTTLAQTYMPILSAMWRSPLPVYDSLITAKQMSRVIREQIYAARRAASSTYGSAGRIGFAWRESGFNTTDDAAFADQLAANLAVALHDAFTSGAGAACVDNDGSGSFYFGCPPAAKTGAAFNTAWNTFKTW